MNVGVYSYSHGDPLLIDKIVNEFLSQGKFDKLRKECMSDADTKPAYQNLQQRVESTVTQFLKKQVWRPDLNKNQLRDTLRKHILDSNFFDAGINRIVDQVVNPNVLATVFLPEVEEVVYNYLSIPKPAEKYAQKKGFSSNESEILKPPGSDTENKSQDGYEKCDKTTTFSDSQVQSNEKDDKYKFKNLHDDYSNKDVSMEITTENIKTEPPGDDDSNKAAHSVRAEKKIKSEEVETKMEIVKTGEMPGNQAKVEPTSDDSQESISRMGVERLRISETDAPRSIDSDDSMPLEINEKSMSESRDSEDSIMNQMSPISQGRLTPDLLEEVDVKPEKEKKPEEEKKPLTFTGRIPKIKRNDSESSKKEESVKSEKLETKNIYSSDESDSSKSYGKSDSDDRKSKDQKKKNERKSHHGDEKKPRCDTEKKKRDDDRHKSSRDRENDRKSRDDRSKDSKDRKRDRDRGRSRERSRDRHRDSKKSSSSSRSSREKSVSHRSSHHSRHRDSRSKDRSRDKKRREEEKKKSKNADDHGKERNKKDDRRSTDRDSNERDRASDSRSQGESRRREREVKTEEEKNEKTQKEEAEVEEEVDFIPESGEVMIEMDGDWVPEGEEIVLVNEDGWICSGDVLQETEVMRTEEAETEPPVKLNDLIEAGALTRMRFPKLTQDFYVKFNSTGFRYFEDWEMCKLDCEEEFKEFVDEAENNLDLLSDDGSDSEKEFNFDEENRNTLKYLLKGLGNFRRGLTFDPASSQFYKWTNNKFYQKFRKKDDGMDEATEKTESDESFKENILAAEEKEKNKENLAREKKALHLKLLNRLKRRAIRQGKQRRRCRRKGSHEGIKEKNENEPKSSPGNVQSLYQPDIKVGNEAAEPAYLASNFSGRITERNDILNKFEKNLAEGESKVREVNLDEDAQSKSRLKDELLAGVKISDVQKKNKLNGLNLGDKDEEAVTRTDKISEFQGHHIHGDCHLPLSPESDDCNANSKSTMIVKEPNSKLKRAIKSDPNADGVRERKQSRRSYCQKYDSQDLYKPRLMLNSSRVRARTQQRTNSTAGTDPRL